MSVHVDIMDNLLQQFENCFSNPEDYLDGSVELRNSCLQLSEALFSYCYDETGRFPTGPLCILHTQGFDNDQIWEQIQLLNEATVKFAKKKIKEINNMEIDSVVTQSLNDGDGELLSDNSENDSEEIEESDHLSDHVSNNEVTPKQMTGTQDMFFNLSEMNKFLQDEDHKYENRLSGGQNEDNDIDLFREMSPEEDHLMYDDFFDPPTDHIENNGDDDDDDNDDDDENEGSSDKDLDEPADQDNEIENTHLSSHQKQQQKVTRSHIIDIVSVIIESKDLVSLISVVEETY